MQNQQQILQVLKRSFKPRRRVLHSLLLLLLVSSASLGGWSTPSVYAQSTPTPDQAASSGRVAVVGVDPAPLYATPGGATVQTLQPGSPVTVVGRSQDSQWVQVNDTTVGKGWMAAKQIIVFGLEELPVVAVANSAPSKTAAPVQATTPATSPVTAENNTNTTPLPAPTSVAPVQTPTPASANNTPATTSGANTATITSSGLNVRAGPGTNYPVIGTAKAGQKYTALARNGANTWVQISFSAQQEGWVAAQFVKLSSAIGALPISAKVSAAPVNQPTATAVATSNQTVQTNPTTNATTANKASASAAGGLQGTLVFAASNGGAIYVYKLATGSLRQLTSGFDPAISPDGSKVAFARDGGDNGLYIINIDGSNEHKIYSGNESIRSPKWSPDGNWIVFGHVSATYLCYQMGPACLTRTDLKKRLPPSIANDPKALEKFLKQSDAEATTNALLGISRVNSNGQEYRDIPALNSATAPDWSNSGIVYQSTAGLQKTADKPDATNTVVTSEHYVQDPDWQPNGGRIVYQSRQGPHWEIFAINDDGSGVGALTRPETTLVNQLPSNVAPAWSPDGQHIVFLSNRENNHEAGAWRIWVMNADGSNQHPLPVNVQLDYSYTDEQAVSWGP
ncbi:MAG: SH3 domain-containing protein [Caldilineaceae bacterium]